MSFAKFDTFETTDTDRASGSRREHDKAFRSSLPESSGGMLGIGMTMWDDLSNILDQNGFHFILQQLQPAWPDRRMRFVQTAASPWRVPRIMPRREGRTYHFAKRLLDIIISLSAITILLPVMLAVAVAIVIEDGAPIVYHQLRAGKGGRPFRFFKFRSMVRNADKVKAQLEQHNEASGPIFKMRNDPRITKVGRFIRKTSLDELPQLLSVLRGDMTVVGPRPLYAPEAAKLDARHSGRHQVQPGLLCLREVCGRSELTFDQWMELDLVYVASRSLRTDLTIILRAIPAILSSHGAY